MQVLVTTLTIKNQNCHSWVRINESIIVFVFHKLLLPDRLLELSDEGYNLSDDYIGMEVLTFMVAGYDTTACGTSHVLYNLAYYQDVQAKARMEIDNIFEQDQGKY